MSQSHNQNMNLMPAFLNARTAAALDRFHSRSTVPPNADAMGRDPFGSSTSHNQLHNDRSTQPNALQNNDAGLAYPAVPRHNTQSPPNRMAPFYAPQPQYYGYFGGNTINNMQSVSTAVLGQVSHYGNVPNHLDQVSQYGNVPNQPGQVLQYGNVPNQPDQVFQYGNVPNQPDQVSQYGNVPNQPGQVLQYGNVPNQLDQVSQYGNVPNQPGQVLQYGNIPNQPDQVSRYGNVPNQPGQVLQYGNVPNQSFQPTLVPNQLPEHVGWEVGNPNGHIQYPRPEYYSGHASLEGHLGWTPVSQEAQPSTLPGLPSGTGSYHPSSSYHNNSMGYTGVTASQQCLEMQNTSWAHSSLYSRPLAAATENSNWNNHFHQDVITPSVLLPYENNHTNPHVVPPQSSIPQQSTAGTHPVLQPLVPSSLLDSDAYSSKLDISVPLASSPSPQAPHVASSSSVEAPTHGYHESSSSKGKGREACARPLLDAASPDQEDMLDVSFGDYTSEISMEEIEAELDDATLDEDLAQAEELERTTTKDILEAMRALAERHATLEERIFATVDDLLKTHKAAINAQEPSETTSATAPRIPGQSRRARDPRSLEAQFTSRAVFSKKEDLGYYYLLLMRIVRLYMEELMGRGRAAQGGQGRKRFVNPLPPPPQDASLPPTLQNFTIAWNHPTYCDFNFMAGEVFVNGLMGDPMYSELLPKAAAETRDGIADVTRIKSTLMQAFWIHVRYLYTQYTVQKKGLTQDQLKRRDRVDARRGRRKTLLKLRKIDCEVTLPAFAPVLRTAGLACISSDDSGPDQGPGKPPLFIAHLKQWRSRKFTALFRALDDRHRRLRVGTRGAPTRYRNVGKQKSRKATPQGLPLNCYNEKWLNGLKENNPQAYNDLNIQPKCHALDAWYRLYGGKFDALE